MALTKYTIGQLIELTTEINEDCLYGANDVKGMTITKQIIPTKADVSTADLSKFLVIHPEEFVFNPRTHGKHIGFGYNNTENSFIISWNNIGFRVKNEMKGIVSPEYLFLHFKRDEWDREACFRSWGSSTEVFSWDALCEMQLELPDLATQQKYVDIYKGMVANQAAYERGLDDLKLVCDGYIEDLRRQIGKTEIGQYIREKKVINSDYQVSKLYGLTNDRGFQKPSAMSDGVDIGRYKCVSYDEIVYPPPHLGEVGTIDIFKYNEGVVSPMYVVFEVSDKSILLPDYLIMWLKRKDFMDYAFFAACDSIRDTFDFGKMCEYSIPIPDLGIQQSIVNIYSAYIERKQINEQLKEQIKNLCPILIRGAVEEAARN